MRRLHTTVGHLAPVQLKADREGKLGDAAVIQVNSKLDSIIGLLNGGLRLGDGVPNSQTGNLSGILLRIIFGTANTEITMPHDLGRVPLFCLPVFQDRACRIYSSRGAAEAWGDLDKAYFTCDTANAKVILILA